MVVFVLVNLVLIASLQRRQIPVGDRRPFHLIVDEFQNFATESFAILQSEARKYAVDVVVAATADGAERSRPVKSRPIRSAKLRPRGPPHARDRTR